MTDYNPDPRMPRDRYTLNERYGDLYDRPEGGSSYAFVALLAAVALVGGFLFFASPQPNTQQAEVPRTNMTAPLEQPAPAPAQTGTQNQAPARLPAAPPEGPIQTPADRVTPTNPQR